jgi:hypothetical protein
MNQKVVINRSTPIGTAIAELLYLMFKHGEALPGVGEISQHEETRSCTTRVKVCLSNHVSGRHYGCRNAWINETGASQFRLYLTDFEETVDLFKHYESFEMGLSKIEGYTYDLAEIHQACKDIQAFLNKGVLPTRETDQLPSVQSKLAA